MSSIPAAMKMANSPAKPILPLRDGRLRPATTGDLDALEALLHQRAVRRYLCDDALLPRETVAAMLEESDRLDGEGLGLWVIEPDDRAFAGIVALQPVSPEASVSPQMIGQIEPTIALDQGFCGQGLATEALVTMIGYARERLALPGLVAAVDEPNARSHDLMRRVGFEVMGTAPGPAHELVLYSIDLGRDDLWPADL